MKLINFLVLIIASAILVTASSILAQLPAFPGAEGFGTTTTHGRGGQVIEVTNTNDSGSGSLREAINTSGARIIVFRVGGLIELESALNISDPYCYIAGQTAPGDGICLSFAPLNISTHDVVVRFIRSRPGDDPSGPNPDNRDGFQIAHSSNVPYNVVIDHCSASWAIDENSSTWYECHDITFQWCLFSEALDSSLHSKGPHSKGLLVGNDAQDISIHHCLFAHNVERNPLLKAGTYADIINNVIYNWKQRAVHLSDYENTGDPIFANVVCNFCKPGNDMNLNWEVKIPDNLNSTSKLYLQGNIGPHRTTDTGDEWLVVDGDETTYRTDTPHSAPSVTTWDAVDAYDKVLNNAGATLPARDAVDARIVQDVIDSTGYIIDAVSETPGYPTYNSGTPPTDSDGDGMPDSFELDNTDPSSSTALNANDTAPSGYTWIEEYVNGLVSCFTCDTTYTLTTNVDGSGSISLDPSGGTYDEGTVVTLTANPDTGNQFDNWSGDLTGTVNPETITMNSDKTVTASFSTSTEDVYDGCAATIVTGACENEHAGHTGAGYANTNNATGTYVEWTVSVSETRSYPCTIRFANGGASARPADIEINSVVQTNVSFEVTGAWTTWSTKDISVNLNNGNNNLRIIATGADGCPNIDKLVIDLTPPVQYDLTVNTSGNGSVSLDPSGGTYDEGTVVTLIANPDAGNQFDNWSGDLTGATNPETITMNSNKTVTANFSVIQYTLTANTSGNGSVSLNPSGGTYDSGTVVTLTANPDAGNQFDNWTGDLTGATNPETITMNSNKSVTANFSVIQYTLTVNTSGNGSVSLDPTGGTYNSGTVVTLTANPDTGNQFDNWAGDLTGSVNPETITMNANKTVTANFSVIQYTLTVNTAGSGSVSLDPSGGTYNSGTVVTLTANPDSGNQFDNWSGDLSGTTNPETITMNNNKNVTANFSEISSIDIYDACDATVVTGDCETNHAGYTGNGFVDTNNSAGTYLEWTNVTVSASQVYNCTIRFANGSANSRPTDININGSVQKSLTFESTGAWTNWSTKDFSVSLNSGSNTFRVVGTSAESCPNIDKLEVDTASPPQYMLTVNTSGSGSVSLDPSGGTYSSGTVVTLTANPDTGNQFDNWSGDLSGSANPETITMNTNKNVTATFSATEQAFQQDSGSDGIVSMEIEHYDDNVSQGSHDWTSNSTSGYSGDGAMEATPNSGTNQNTNYAANSPRMDYKVNFVKTGTHYVWARGIGASGADDSYHAGLDGQEISTSDRCAGFSTSWDWSNSTLDAADATFEVTSIGIHTVNVWMREDGFVIDKLVLTVNSSYTPSGTGPAESQRSGITQYTLTVNTSGSGSVTLDPSGGTYNEGTVVTLTANPDAGNQFDNWTGDLSGSSNPETITMNADKNVTATFSESEQAFQQDTGSDGIVSMEAEHYDDNVSQGGDSWTSNSTSGYSGDGAMEVTPNDGTSRNTGYAANSPRMDFKVNFVKTGTHYIWARGIGPTGYDDSYHAGLDGQEISTCDRCGGFSTAWDWSNSTMDAADATFNVSSTGLHTVNVWMREDGFILDKIVLTVNSGYTPSGTGPAESSRGPAKALQPEEETVETEQLEVVIPDEMRLVQNYPNPFNPTTTITYSLPEASQVKMAVYDMKGRLVSLLVDDVKNAGEYTHVWEAVDPDGNQLPSGMYLCRFQAGSHVETIKMMFMR